MGAEAETGEWATAPVTPGAEREESLPATASALPLAGLTGVLALMGAAALAVARRHRRR
jgi:LPXTG-motif cell wall-anchored protein